MKTCNTCKRPLPVSEFYAHPMSADGLCGDCKECYRAKKNGRTSEVMEMLSLRTSAQFIARHEAKRAREREIELELTKMEKRAEVKPLSFAGVVEPYFRSQKKNYKWSIG